MQSRARRPSSCEYLRPDRATPTAADRRRRARTTRDTRVARPTPGPRDCAARARAATCVRPSTRRRRHVRAVVLREPFGPCQPFEAHGLEADAARLDPEPELHPVRVRFVGERAEAARKPLLVGGPRTQSALEVVEAERARAGVPA